jgi:hypothetical protein
MNWSIHLDFANNAVFESDCGKFTVYFSRGFWNLRHKKTPEVWVNWVFKTVPEAKAKAGTLIKKDV